MRLLNIDSLELTEFRDREKPPYAIASHRWQEGEITYQELCSGLNKHKQKQGFKKVEAFARYVRVNVRSIKWLWIDTCCINKESAAEMSKSINLMFDWYREADVCIAYLSDVSDTRADVRDHFVSSEWFERGWTLQELLAPKTVVFVTQSWQLIGNKGASSHGYCGTPVGVGLENRIAAKTGIPEEVLHDYNGSQNLTVDTKLKWIDGRKTSEPEDMAYALFGILGVTPGANYGERHDGARKRLLAAVHQQEDRAAQQAAQFRDIADWLSPPLPWTNHESARQRHEERTGLWLLQSDQYRSWKTGSVRSLWVCGKAGCGKSVLCSTAIEDVRMHCGRSANTGYAIFYFTFSDTRKQSVKDLLLSLLAQLGWREPGLSMLQQAYTHPNAPVPGLDDLEQILLASLKSYDEFYLLTDALDECPEGGDTRQSVLEFLARLSRQASNLQIFATSREAADIRRSMETLGATSFSFVEHAVNADIRKYIATQLSRDHRLSRLEPALKNRIEETISSKADGMFRWAYCQLQELKKLKSTRPTHINEALNSLPKTLDETYERMLTGIELEFRQDALTLLRWLAYAVQPPTLGMLVDAAVIDPESNSVNLEDRGSIEDTLQILSGLVTVLGGDEPHRIREYTKVGLAHFSVKEYLESNRIAEGDARMFQLQSGPAHRFLAQSCLEYMAHYSASGESRSRNEDLEHSVSEDLENFPLLKYAAGSWFDHSSLQQTGDVKREVSLLSSRDAVYDWLRIHRLEGQNLFGLGSGLYYASRLGLEPVVQVLIDAGADVNAQGGECGNALETASGEGNEKVVQILLDAGADVNTYSRAFYETALIAASTNGHENVVQILMEAGADLNPQTERYGNALSAAIEAGQEKIVCMLIDAGADVNARGGVFGHALYAASQLGDEKVVQLLVDAGADVNARGGFYGCALHAASIEGHEEVVRVLIDAGADVNVPGGHYGTALLAILGEPGDDNEKMIVQMLIEAGADFNVRYRYGRDTLEAALKQDSDEDSDEEGEG